MRYELTVIAPCFNESFNLIELAERLLKVFEKKKINGQIILVNDASLDNTGEIIDDLAKKNKNIIACHHERNKGIVEGWRTGLKSSGGVFVCLIDSDLQNLPEDVWRLYQEIRFSNADLVQGWRNHIGKLKNSRYFLTRGLNFVLNLIFGMSSKDNKSGFVVCRREVLEDILNHRFSYRFYQTFITIAAKYKDYSVREIETLFQNRVYGKSFISSFGIKESFFTLVDIFKAFFEFKIFPYDSDLKNFIKKTKRDTSQKKEKMSFLRRLYFNLYLFFFPLHHWFISYNSAMSLKDFNESQWLSADEIKKYQEGRLKKLIAKAYYHVPFYRELFDSNGLKPEDIKTIDDLQKIPIIDKNVVRENMYFFLSDNHNKKHIQKMQTSGSTGEPFSVFGEKKQLEMRWAANQRSLEWTGYRFGDKQVRLWHKYLGMKTKEILRELADAFFSRRKFIPAYEISDANLKKYVDDIMKYKPVLLDGYAESFNFLAQFLKNNPYNGHKPKAIITSAQTLPRESRKIIESSFNCKIFDKYGSREFGGGVAYQCGHGNNYHIVAECNIVEIIKDGKKAKPGEIGEVVITELNNYAMPLMRYKIGDLAMAVDENTVCSCGRGLPMIGEIQGRLQSVVVGTSNQFIPGTFFNRVFFKHDLAIKQYQIVQERKGELIVKIIKGNIFTDSVLDEILKDIKKHMGEDLKIVVEFANEIPLGRTGKRQYCVSKIDPLDISLNLKNLEGIKN